MTLRASQRTGHGLLDSWLMPATFPREEEAKTDNVQALVRLLRTRSYEEIRQRMYDNPPGSEWWSACKIELEIRNGEQVAAALSMSARVLEKLRSSTQHFEQLAETLSHAATDMAAQLHESKEAGRRLEIAVYVAIGMTLVQFFNLVFEIFRKR